MSARLLSLFWGILPAFLAFGAVLLEPTLTSWARQRESILPFVLIILLSSFFHPRMRTILASALCYGVSFLALRDLVLYHNTPLPRSFDYAWVVQMRLLSLCLVAGMAAFAAIAETVRPGTVWARRCYFGAAGVYFTGVGLMNLAWHANWQSLLLFGTGVIAFFGLLYADRIIASEEEAEEEGELDDDQEQHLREEAHRTALRAKEWQDTPAG